MDTTSAVTRSAVVNELKKLGIRPHSDRNREGYRVRVTADKVRIFVDIDSHNEAARLTDALVAALPFTTLRNGTDTITVTGRKP